MAELQPGGRAHSISVLLKSVQTFLCPVGLHIVQPKGLPSAFCPGWRKPAHVEFSLTSPGWCGCWWFSCLWWFFLSWSLQWVCCFPSLPAEPVLFSCCRAHAGASEGSAVTPGIVAERAAEHSHTRLWTKLELGVSPGRTSPQPWAPSISGTLCQSHFLPTLLNHSAFQLYC